MSTASIIEVGNRDSAVPATLDRFRDLFNRLDAGNLDQLPSVYAENIQFEDPFSSVSGLDQLTHYFAGAYANVIACRFDFGEPVVNGENVGITWVMYLRHKRIRRGQEIHVEGMSRLVIRNGKVARHRDYFDAGQLLYENLPVVGGLIRWVRNQAG